MKIILIVPYFGKLPNYFQLFLNSCKNNQEYKWLIITDDKTNYSYPENVDVRYTTFEVLRDFIQKKFQFKIALDKPYKLCDFKPTYGYIFEEYIKDYDFWGHCDLDIVFGKISNFITIDMLNKYEKIFDLGHFTLYKNTKENNERFKLLYSNRYLYKEVLSNPEGSIFDESYNNSINNIFEENNFTMYRDNVCADIYTKSSNFKNVTYDKLHNKIIEKNKKALYIWNNGQVFRYYMNKTLLVKEEFMYIHLQKRPMEIKIDENIEYYKIIPNSFEKIDIPIDVNNFKYIKRKNFNLFYFQIRFNNLKVKLKRRI